MKQCPKCGDHIVAGPYHDNYVQWACGSSISQQSVKCRIKVLERKVAKLQYFAGQVKSVYKLLQDEESPDFVSWMEHMGEAAIEVLNETN